MPGAKQQARNATVLIHWLLGERLPVASCEQEIGEALESKSGLLAVRHAFSRRRDDENKQTLDQRERAEVIAQARHMAQPVTNTTLSKPVPVVGEVKLEEEEPITRIAGGFVLSLNGVAQHDDKLHTSTCRCRACSLKKVLAEETGKAILSEQKQALVSTLVVGVVLAVVVAVIGLIVADSWSGSSPVVSVAHEGLREYVVHSLSFGAAYGQFMMWAGIVFAALAVVALLTITAYYGYQYYQTHYATLNELLQPALEEANLALDGLTFDLTEAAGPLSGLGSTREGEVVGTPQPLTPQGGPISGSSATAKETPLPKRSFHSS